MKPLSPSMSSALVVLHAQQPAVYECCCDAYGPDVPRVCIYHAIMPRTLDALLKRGLIRRRVAGAQRQMFVSDEPPRSESFATAHKRYRQQGASLEIQVTEKGERATALVRLGRNAGR